MITVRKRSCGKVMFSQVCVKNSVNGRNTPRAGTPPPPVADGTHPTGMYCSLIFFFYRHMQLTILALLPFLYSHIYLQFSSLFAPHDVSKCKIKWQWVKQEYFLQDSLVYSILVDPETRRIRISLCIRIRFWTVSEGLLRPYIAD